MQVCRDQLCCPVSDFRPMFGIAPAEMGLETRQFIAEEYHWMKSKKVKGVDKKLVVRSMSSSEKWTSSYGYISSTELQGITSSQSASQKYCGRASTTYKFGQLSSISYLLSRYKVSQETMMFSPTQPQTPNPHLSALTPN